MFVSASVQSFPRTSSCSIRILRTRARFSVSWVIVRKIMGENLRSLQSTFHVFTCKAVDTTSLYQLRKATWHPHSDPRLQLLPARGEALACSFSGDLWGVTPSLICQPGEDQTPAGCFGCYFSTNHVRQVVGVNSGILTALKTRKLQLTLQTLPEHMYIRTIS